MSTENNPVVLLATLGLGVLIAGIGYIGWWYGHEQGACEARCRETTSGEGEAVYRGGTCRCTLNSVEVVFP